MIINHIQDDFETMLLCRLSPGLRHRPGLSAERVVIQADASVHPDFINSRFGYVSISRASHGAMLFTNDVAKLSPQLADDVSKNSALEIQSPSITQGIGIRI